MITLDELFPTSDDVGGPELRAAQVLRTGFGSECAGKVGL